MKKPRSGGPILSSPCGIMDGDMESTEDTCRSDLAFSRVLQGYFFVTRVTMHTVTCGNDDITLVDR